MRTGDISQGSSSGKKNRQGPHVLAEGQEIDTFGPYVGDINWHHLSKGSLL